MIKIRALTLMDIPKVLELHKKYYNQFEFPPFGNCINAFVIEDERDEIILAGSVEMVAEAMLVTNKAKGQIKIGKALVEAQSCCAYTCSTVGIRDLYAFVDSDVYAKHLIKHGFIESDRALKLRIP